MTGIAPARFAHLGTVDVSRRDDRWLASGANLIAFAADGEREWARLVTEAVLLRRWRAAGVPVPRVRDEDAVHRIQVRERLDGITGEAVEPLLFGIAAESSIARGMPDAHLRLDAACPLSPFGERLADSYGALAAMMHAAVTAGDARTFGIATKPPMDLAAALAHLRASPIERALVAKAERARAWIAKGETPSVVVHGDLHFHNMCLATDGTITGVFDIGDAHLDSPEADFHYVHSLGPRFVKRALAACGAALDEDAIRRAHVRTALHHLTFIGPESPRYPSMVSWNTAVIDHLVP